MKMACMDCGTNYESPITCVCPECGSGVLNQLKMNTVEVFKKKSSTHKVPSNYLSRPKKKSGLDFDFVQYGPEFYTDLEDYEQSEITVDYLCFTVKISDFRHCKKESPYSGFHFPDEPQYDNFIAKKFSDLEAYQRFFKESYTDYLQECVRRFIQYVLGFNYGAPRGKGFQFYNDSFVLTSEFGDDYCGQVGFGGNNDTIHFQITGHGCKHLFSQRTCAFLHHWISTVLCCKSLSRVDLAYDCYDDLHTCEAAEKAALKGAFKRSRGFAPKIGINDEYEINSDGKKVYSRKERTFGSRQSNCYWRIYDKKLERKIVADNFTWTRSEVELKKWDVDILLNIVGGFIALNEYAASLVSSKSAAFAPAPTRSLKGRKRAACDVLSTVFWAKRQYGRLVNSLLDLYENDYQKVVTTLLRDDTLLKFPSMHQKLINSLE